MGACLKQGADWRNPSCLEAHFLHSRYLNQFSQCALIMQSYSLRRVPLRTPQMPPRKALLLCTSILLYQRDSSWLRGPLWPKTNCWSVVGFHQIQLLSCNHLLLLPATCHTILGQVSHLAERNQQGFCRHALVLVQLLAEVRHYSCSWCAGPVYPLSTQSTSQLRQCDLD